ncbi:MAG: hypothetical protein IJE00_07070, partial [Clostridia bacterium]|nr:hypothetical protein [Clostridia bacterium]
MSRTIAPYILALVAVIVQRQGVGFGIIGNLAVAEHVGCVEGCHLCATDPQAVVDDRCCLLKHGLDLHIFRADGKRIVGHDHVTGEDLPFFELIALVRGGGQGDFGALCAGSRIRRSCAVAVIGYGDGVGGGEGLAGNVIINIVLAIFPHSHLGIPGQSNGKFLGKLHTGGMSIVGVN